MPRRPDVYHRPQDLGEALRLLKQPDTAPLAGGTKLLAEEAGLELSGVVDLQAVGLDEIKWVEGQLQIGATATLTAVANFLATDANDDNTPSPLLQRALHQAGPNTYRNAATIGGTLASRLPDSELLATFLVLTAQLQMLTPAPITIPLTDYLATPDAPVGLITALTVPWSSGRGDGVRVARTPADYPIVSMTLWQSEGAPPRLAATGIGERPLRLTHVEEILSNGITAETIETAATAAQTTTRHPGDFRGNADYRAEMAAVLTRRVCQQLL